MFGRPFPLFRAFGFSVKADPSWLVVVALAVWMLARHFFPHRYHGFAESTYWLMGLFGAAGFFASIVLHEFGHSLVARLFGMPIRGITLFIFGGVAEMADEPPTAKAEFAVAAAGPLTSAAIGAAAFAGWWAGMHAEWPRPVHGVLFFLWTANLSLVAFNLVPAFPLDGGRMLRALLWSVRGNLRGATRITGAIGSAFGLLLIGLGVVQIVWGFGGRGGVLGGVWSILIGMFLRAAASAGYRRVLIRQALEGDPVRRFMTPDPVTAPAEATLREFDEHCVDRYPFKTFPVVDTAGRLLGCIPAAKIRQVPRDRWEVTAVRELTEACSDDNTVPADADAVDALSRMQRLGLSRLMVTDAGRLVGVFGLKDALKLMALKVELGDRRPESEPPRSAAPEREPAAG